MAAYMIFNIHVTDPAAFERYRAQVAPLVAQYGGRYLVRGGEVSVLEGDPGLDRVVVLEFPDSAAARRFYASPEYAPLLNLRTAAATSHGAIVEGLAP